MKPLVYLTIVIFAITGCRQRFGAFHDMDKWLIHPDDDRRPLNDHPKEVSEYNYRASDTEKPENQRNHCYTYGFNTAGNLISRAIYLNDTLVFTWKAQFDSNGCQTTDTDLISHQIETQRTRPLGDGHFKDVINFEDNPVHAEIVGFSLDGDELMREIYDDTLARGKAERYHYYYSGIRITKVEGSGKKADFKKKYYYSKWDTPDSIELYAVKLISWVVEREYFLINGHGDPTRHLTIDGKDTVEFQLYQYEYDRHGNWTRKMTTTLKGQPKGKYDLDPSVPRVVDREFVY